MNIKRNQFEIYNYGRILSADEWEARLLRVKDDLRGRFQFSEDKLARILKEDYDLLQAKRLQEIAVFNG
jgi:hypothetical protein